ncbi:MAG: hypothetical protein IJW79_03340 [Clostridia bacterium]|nr:hypothetical protein [Clostridia bacterium]
MKKDCLLLRILTVALAVVTLGGAVCLPAAAVDIEEEPLSDFLWELDFNKMSDIADNRGSTDYTVEAHKNLQLTDAHGKKALSVVEKNCTYIINDLNSQLDEYDSFSIEADMFFETYPHGTGSNGKTPNEYPMSFVTWITGEDAGKSPNYRSIRVDGDGYLCTGSDPINKPEQRSSAKLPLGEWFNIRFLISPVTGFCEVYINGRNLLSYELGRPKADLIRSQVRFFDTRYAYTAYFSNISVYTDSSYRIGLAEEASADFVGYQTAKVKDNSFDIRLVAGTDIADISSYNSIGFTVTTMMMENGKEVATEKKHYDVKVYESIVADGKSVSAESLGSKYLAAIPIEDIPADKGHIEIAARPYVKKDGIRTYGKGIILSFSGEVKDGYPILDTADSSIQYTATPSDDTYVKLTALDNFAGAEQFELKNNGADNAYTREIYAKFSFSPNALRRLLSSTRIYLEFYSNSHRELTAEEEAAGGILADVCGVDTAWSESELNGRNYKELAKEMEYIGEVRYRKKYYSQIDVTEYVLENAKEGEVAFKISNVEQDGSGAQARISSIRLVAYPISYNHEINLSKMQNLGYEPWGYAEKLVDEWFGNDYDKLFGKAPAETLGLTTVNNKAPVGDYTVRVDWTQNSPYSNARADVYARSIDTLTGFEPKAASEYDEFGGITNSGIKGEATGFFHTETHGNRTYIIDPIGNPFFAVSINSAQLGATQNQKDAAIEKYGSAENFYNEVSDTLRSIGINTYLGGDIEFLKTGKLNQTVPLGCISGYMGRLNLSVGTGGSAAYMHNNTMNVFDPDFESFCVTNTASKLEKYSKNEPNILGIYSDNEIPAESNMLYRYLTIDPSEPVNAFSYATAWTWLVKRTGNPNASLNDITEEMYEEFKGFVYNRYFECVTAAIKEAGYDHYMYMGNKIHSDNYTSEGYLRAAGNYVDVLTSNLYGGLTPKFETMETMYKYTGKPFFVTEFFAKAQDAVDMNGYSLGNQHNAGITVATQKDRAAYYEHYTLLLIESQACVGWSWYRFRDNDQTIFKDDAGNLYRATDYRDKQISAYTNVLTGAVIEDGPALAPSLSVYYKGESDTSNLGSNKGFFDNKMNLYEEVAGAAKRVTDNLFDLIGYFDGLHK